MNSPAPSAPPYDDNPPPYAPHTMNYMVPPAYPRPVVYPPQENAIAVAQRPVAVRKEEPACCTILMAICCCCVLMEEEDNSTRY